MKITFVSNYFNHHQQALCEALNRQAGGAFRFVATGVMRQERKNMGYEMDAEPAYVLHTYTDAAELEEAKQWIIDADLVITGSAPEELLKERKNAGKLIFKYSERPLKKGLELHKYIYRRLRWRKAYSGYANYYLLCASAYTAADYKKFGLFKKKCYRWGYFPEVKQYEDVQGLLSAKKKNSILWAGRFLKWKHPDAVIRLAKRLKDSAIPFELNLIGAGEMEQCLRNEISKFQLEDCVHILGTMKPTQVREYMEKSQIYLFTSDRNEGWGAVLNESMNSGCAVVASHAIGSVPFLLQDGINGSIYKSGDEEELYEKVKRLISDPQMCRRYGCCAYNTMQETWNAQVAAQRVVELANAILGGDHQADLFECGPCSTAAYIKDNWYHS